MSESSPSKQSSLVTLGVIFGGFVLFSLLNTPSTAIVQNPQPAMVVEAAATTTPLEAGLPAELIIPAIEVDAKIEPLGLSTTALNEMAVPGNVVDVGWYKYGPHPGMRGSAVIDGHLNGRNVPEGVFFKLDTLNVNDSVFVVDETGKKIEFIVLKVKTYRADESTEEVFSQSTDDSLLNLITCAGTWISSESQYENRTVVFTKRVVQ